MLRGTHWPQGRVGLWASPRMSKIPGLAHCVQDGKSIVWGRWSCGVPSLCCGAGRWKYHIPADAPSTAIPGCAAPARPGSYLQQQYSCWHLTFCFRSFASVPVQLSAPCQEPSKEHSAPCLLEHAAGTSTPAFGTSESAPRGYGLVAAQHKASCAVPLSLK